MTPKEAIPKIISKRNNAHLAVFLPNLGDKNLASTVPMRYKAFPNVFLPRLKNKVGT